VPTDLAAGRAPSIALPISVTWIALAAKLFRISHKHGLDGRSPSLQAQALDAALEKGDNASLPVARAVPWLNLSNSICFVMASIFSLLVCDSQPQA
jgi:hypothetical protein